MEPYKKCPICYTPGVQISADGHQVCLGCGVTPLRELVLWLRRERKRIDFYRVTEKYRVSRSALSFGSWIVARNFRLEARP
jgi:hypothetical protein